MIYGVASVGEARVGEVRQRGKGRGGWKWDGKACEDGASGGIGVGVARRANMGTTGGEYRCGVSEKKPTTTDTLKLANEGNSENRSKVR